MLAQNYLRVVAILSHVIAEDISDIQKHPNWKKLPLKNCGYGAMADRIVGGKEASLGQFPWMARIGYNISGVKSKMMFLCDGLIINQWYILTAAHCMQDILGETISIVRIGENFLDAPVNCEKNVCAPIYQETTIKKYKQFENFDKPKGSHYGDIALIELNQPVKYNDFVKAICLPGGEVLINSRKHLKVGSKVEVAGWGLIDSVTQKPANRLMYVEIPIVELDICKKAYEAKLIDESHICAGEGVGRDSCVGDSGGPLMKPVALNGPPRYFVFGLVSYGMKLCGSNSALYTNVSHYMKWVLNNLEK